MPLDREVSWKHVLGGLVFLGFLIYVLVGLASKSSNSGTADRGIPESTTLEYQLATINAGYRVESYDPTIAQFSSLLDSLERKCANSRQQIADATVAAQDLLRKKGVKLKLIDVMRNLNDAIPEEAAGSKLSIAEVAAAWVTLTDRAK